MRKVGSRWLVAGLAICLYVTASCTRKTETETSQSGGAYYDTTSGSPPASSPGDANLPPLDTVPADPSASGKSAVKPAETIAGIQQQLASEQNKLGAAIQAGRIDDVHRLALNVRDLAVALSGKASGASGAASMEQAVNEVVTITEKLTQHGDSKNLGGAQQEFAQLQPRVAALIQITSKS